MKSGIDIVGDIPEGTHFCQFYQNTQDLLDILVPYFRAGLENNEYCLWVAKSPQEKEEVKEGLKRSLGDVAPYEQRGQLEFALYEGFYLKDGVFYPQGVLNGLSDWPHQASAKGYTGLRAAGDVSWLVRTNWEEFIEYEKQLDSAIHGSRTLILCVCLLSLFSASELIEWMRVHGFLLIRHGGEWVSLGPASQTVPTEELTPLQRWFLKAGFEGLNDREMIELLLSTVSSSTKTDKIIREIMTRFKDVGTFLAASPQELEQAGIPPHAISGIKLLHELPAEILRQKILEKPVYTSSKEIFDYLYFSMRDLKQEVFKVVFLNSQAQIIEVADLHTGTITRTAISPRQIIEDAIRHGAVAFIFVHNHPSGDPTPSTPDKQLTRDLVFVGMFLQIKVLDHIIIGYNRYFSFADDGLIKKYETDYLGLRLRGASKAKRAPRK